MPLIGPSPFARLNSAGQLEHLSQVFVSLVAAAAESHPRGRARKWQRPIDQGRESFAASANLERDPPSAFVCSIAHQDERALESCWPARAWR